MQLKVELFSLIISLALLISHPVLADESVVSEQQYLDSIYKKIYSELRLWKAQKGSSCEVVITQDRQGNILNSSVDNCTVDDEYFIKQLTRAVKKSSPLPKAPVGLFSENIVINPIVNKDINIPRSLKKEARNGNDKAIKFIKAIKTLRRKAKFERNLSKQLLEMYKNNDSRAIEIYNNIGKSLDIKSR